MSLRSENSYTFNTWNAMCQRVNNPNHRAYRWYGGKGIKICERWRKFKNFLEDMGTRPKGLTLDRIDSNKGYCLENCRWATAQEQANNRSLAMKKIIDRKTKILLDGLK